ncbi:hypothetical protein BRD56_06365 [Thermoplasmatales archaeon SW_10_69_26]|nr:MAG: hypothetical protein BRD56_06365 [Thermoplasmatales archaeon SW_10_69_26]
MTEAGLLGSHSAYAMLGLAVFLFLAPGATATASDAEASPGLLPGPPTDTDHDEVRSLLASTDDAEDASLATVLGVAEDVSDQQARSVGVEAAKAQPSSSSASTVSSVEAASLSKAVAELAHRHDARLSGDGRASLAVLETSSPEMASAMADLVSGFIQLEAASMQAFEDIAIDERAPTIAAGPDQQGSALESVHEEALTEVFAARSSFLDAVNAFATASQSSPDLTVDACPALVIDSTATDRPYEGDCAFVLDDAGNDTYRNNAGGTAEGFPAAGLVDLAGDDTYGDVEAPRCCGANGGGLFGAGLLVDGSGDDVYHAASRAVNGGGQAGLGLLVDADGRDRYQAGHEQTVTCETDACYARAGSWAVNGGAYMGAGTLVDGGGSDAFRAGVNASASCEAPRCWAAVGSQGVNGGGYGGPATLVSLGGDDRYEAATNATADCTGYDCHAKAGGQGVNGGSFAGAGRLLDAAGGDRYDAGVNARGVCDDFCEVYVGSRGTNGGGSYGPGALVDAQGTDVYRASVGPQRACEDVCYDDDWNGEGGILFDAGGIGDEYHDPEVDCTDCTRAPREGLGALVDVNP